MSKFDPNFDCSQHVSGLAYGEKAVYVLSWNPSLLYTLEHVDPQGEISKFSWQKSLDCWDSDFSHIEENHNIENYLVLSRLLTFVAKYLNNNPESRPCYWRYMRRFAGHSLNLMCVDVPRQRTQFKSLKIIQEGANTLMKGNITLEEVLEALSAVNAVLIPKFLFAQGMESDVFSPKVDTESYFS